MQCEYKTNIVLQFEATCTCPEERILDSEHVDLADFPNLRMLKIAIDPRYEPAAQLLHLLPQVSSPILETIEFDIWAPWKYRIESWSSLDDLLASSTKFPKLRNVRVNTSATLQTLKSWFPKNEKLLAAFSDMYL